MRNMCIYPSHPLFFILMFFLSIGHLHAGLKIYYIRHAEGGHNVKAAWEKKGFLMKVRLSMSLKKSVISSRGVLRESTIIKSILPIVMMP